MELSRNSLLLLAGVSSLPWRSRVFLDAEALSSFPAYCSKDMSLWNKIPSLAESVTSSFGDSLSPDDVQLLQVHAIIRNGAHAPYTAPKCWDGYDMRWDCNVTEVVSPSLSTDDGGVSSTGLFRKRYDAYPSDNALGGTCMQGQLLDEGYTQEQENGRHLRDVYVCGETLCLFSNDSASDLQDNGALYLRSDDKQRTVMSGQILTASMLNVSGSVLDWHTGDDAYDYLKPNTEACPRLKELSEEAMTSLDWIEWTESPEAKLLNDSMQNVWGPELEWWDVLDCLMTTACTGRTLPDGLSQALFDDAVAYSAKKYAHESLHNDAAYGKLAMAKLTLEIREHMMGAINGTSPLKFVLISGHDTTFIPFMSAVAPDVWDQRWPPYASLSTIELVRVGGEDGREAAAEGGGDFAGDYFRFVYNGEVVRLEGCDQDICAIDAFLNATQFSVDLQGNGCCCVGNMTQADGGIITANSSVSPSHVTVTGTGAPETPVPTPAGSSLPVTGAVDSNNKSGLVQSGTATSDGSDAARSSAVGIAVACFVIGAVVGGVPALMYFRRFRYEAMVGGGHSYEMT